MSAKTNPSPRAKADSHAATRAKSRPARLGGDLFRHPDATFDGKVHKGVDKQVAALPFVRARKRGEKGGRCFWSVKPSGKYSADYEQGRTWARMVLPLLKYNVGAPLVSWIIVDMIKAGERNGLVLGFTRRLADELKNARQVAVFAFAFNNPKAPAVIKKIATNPKTRKALLELRPKIGELIRTHYRDAV